MLPPRSPSPAEAFQVGNFLVLPERNELWEIAADTERPRGPAIRLTAKQMDLLVLLASRPGQPLSKGEIFEAIWPGVVVGEDNITSCIYELRKAFGDQGYIKNVRQRGYLLAPRVVRPLPPGLLDELGRQAEPGAADEKGRDAAPGPTNAAASEPEPAPPGTLPGPPADAGDDRDGKSGGDPSATGIPVPTRNQIRRQLLFWLGLLALLVAGGFALVQRWGTFTVGLTGVENLSPNSELDPVARLIERRFFSVLSADEERRYYRLRQIPFLAGTRIRCEITLSEDGLLELRAEVSGDRTGPLEWVQVTGRRESYERLVTSLIEGIGRVLDSRVCRMDTRVDLTKARHCAAAGNRLRISRSYDEATLHLERAVTFYRMLVAESDAAGRQEAAYGLLDGYDQLANTFDILGERDRAEANIEAALALLAEPSLGFTPAHALRIQRRAAQIRGEVAAERELLNQLRDLEPDDTRWRHSLGWFLRTHDRDCAYAELQFSEAIAGAADDPATRATYYSYKGNIQLACDQPLAAIESFSKHIEATPDAADPYDMRAGAYLMVGRYEEARDDLNTALRLDPNLSSAIRKKGQLELELGHFKDAAREFRTFRERFGRYPNPRRDIEIAIGSLALFAGEPGDAEAAARAALEAGGGNQVRAHWLLGLAQLAQGRTAEAAATLAILEQSFAGSPSRFQREYLNHLRGQVALAEGRGEEALHELGQALANRPMDKTFFLLARAEALKRLGRAEEALRAYEELLALNARHPRALCAAAGLAQSLASPERARSFYARAEEILSQQTDDPVGRECLERSRLAAGRPGEQQPTGGSP